MQQFYKTEIWDKQKVFTLADGQPRPLEDVAKEFPFINDPDGVIVLEYITPNRVGAINDLWMLRTMHDIDLTVSDEDALAEYIEKRDTPPPEPSPQPGSIADDFIIGLMEGLEE